jgi:hypothetical protein
LSHELASLLEMVDLRSGWPGPVTGGCDMDC